MKKKNIQKTKNHKEIKISTIISLFCAILVAIYTIVFIRANNSLLEISSKDILKATSNISETFSSTFKSDVVILEAYANSIESSIQKDEVTKESFSNFIQSQYKGSKYSYNDIIYISKDGDYWTSSDKKINLTQDEIQQVFNNTNSPNQNNPNLVMSHNGYVFSYIPVETNDVVSGMLIGIYNTEDLKNTYLSSLYGKDGVSFIIDSSGNVLINSNKNNQYNISFESLFDIAKISPSNVKAQEIIKSDLKAGKSGYQRLYINDAPFIVSYSPIDDINDWYSLSIVPRSVALMKINYLVFASILIGAFVIVLITIIGYSYSKSKIQHSENIQKLAYNDHLTGYPNFLKFKIDAEKILDRNKNMPYYLCYVDMVGFKFVNEAFGYDVGDNVLKYISKLFADSLEEDEAFARVSGDRFIILKKNNSKAAMTTENLYALVDNISKIPPLISSRMRIEVHVGAYLIGPDNELKINAMFDRAIIALESIPHQDSGYAIYDDELRVNQLEKKFIEQKMDAALKNGEFHVYIQPKYKTSDRTLAAGEALIRWHDPEKGIIPPIKFIPLFEKNRFIFNLDRYVLEVVCRFIRERLDSDNNIVPISLNVSPVEILMPNFTESYISIKQKYNIPDGIIELEFTEGVFFENQALFKEVIIELKNAGFCCSLDDFGSGYSSLNVLKEMPVDVLKLDRLFFKESENIVRDRSLIRSVVAMARSLKIKTVAEGVETLDTVEFLKIIGCNMIQGFIYARPMPLHEFEMLMDIEHISDFTDFSEDYDKFSELIPVDKPYDIPLRSTYDTIFEFNINSTTYHLYKQDGCQINLDGIDEIGDYSDDKTKNSILSKVHPDDIQTLTSVCNADNLKSFFEAKRELKFDIRVINKKGRYFWVRCRLLKAKNIGEHLVLFAYIKNIDDQKQQDDLLSTAETRLSSAFVGVAGLVYELDLTNGHLCLVKSYSKSMNHIISGDQYETVSTFIGSYLIHPQLTERYNKECSFIAIREAFSQCPNKSLSYEYLAKPGRDADTYRWYSVRYSYTPELSDKVLIALQDISNRKYTEGKKDARSKLITLANEHVFDELIEINLTKDTYKLVKMVDKETHKEEKLSGSYSEFYDNSLHNHFLAEDREFLSEIISLKGLMNMFNDPNVADFTVNIKKKVQNDTYQWHSFYLVTNKADIYFPDSLVFIFIKNIQFEKDIHDKLSKIDRRLNFTTGMFELAYELDINSQKVAVFGGSNIPTGIFIDKPMQYSKLIETIKDIYIHTDDLGYFDNCMSLNSLSRQLKSSSSPVSFFVRCKLDNIKWISVNHIFDSRSNIATVFIQNIDNKNTNN